MATQNPFDGTNGGFINADLSITDTTAVINQGSATAMSQCWKTGFQTFYLITSNEYFANSGLVSTLPSANYTANLVANATMAKATYGQLWGLYAFLKEETGTDKIGAQTPDAMIFVGTSKGAGIAFRFSMADDSGTLKTSAIETKFTVTSTSNVANIAGPAGGMGQFKGLTQGTEQVKYVQVICKGVAPLYYTTYPKNLDSAASNGWIVTCYTGISQCA